MAGNFRPPPAFYGEMVLRLPAFLTTSLAMLVAVPAALAAPGDFDQRFGRGGTVFTQFSELSRATAVAFRNNRIVVAGQVFENDGPGRQRRLSQLAVARYEPDGTLDSDFGSGGQATLDFEGYDAEVAGVAVLGSGKVVVAGTLARPGAESAFVLVRLLASGVIDRDFGVDGRAFGHFAAGSDGRVHATAFVRQPNGRFVIGGYERFESGGQVRDRPLMVRYLADGRQDPTFHGSGDDAEDDLPADGSINAVAIDSSGRVLAAGSEVVEDTIRRQFVVRFGATTGRVDRSFGTRGVARSPLASDDSVGALLAQRSGRVVVAGGAGFRVSLTRYTSRGKLDRSFGRSGTTRDFYGGSYAALAQEPGGKLLAGGQQGRQFVIARYSASGRLDRSFGNRGRRQTSFGPGEEALAALVLPGDGTALGVGLALSRFALARYEL